MHPLILIIIIFILFLITLLLLWMLWMIMSILLLRRRCMGRLLLLLCPVPSFCLRACLLIFLIEAEMIPQWHQKLKRRKCLDTDHATWTKNAQGFQALSGPSSA